MNLRAALASLFLLALLVGSASAAANKKCYALALAGGGDKGAYEAGAVKAFIDKLPADQVQWDVISGISVGSINTAAMGLFAKGDEKNMAEFLVNTWKGISADQVYKKWPGGDAEGLFFKNAIFDSSPLREYLTNHLKSGLKDRMLVFGTTSLTTGEFMRYNESEPMDRLVSAVMASAAIPGIFPPISMDGHEFADGGVKMIVNIFDAVARCVTSGYELTDIVLDVILCTGAHIQAVDIEKDRTLGILLRTLEVRNYDHAVQLIEDARLAFPTVQFRYFVEPSKPLPGAIIPLVFDPKDIQEMIDVGYQDASNVLAKGPNNMPPYVSELVLKRKHEMFDKTEAAEL
eukprot:GILI01006326.1.p1 GENE.GILI01006326.1~~GILI01006326.1.p1  ORF type:complete len:346 (-),score=117.87 GILI01006326.1:190-1227(-)